MSDPLENLRKLEEDLDRAQYQDVKAMSSDINGLLLLLGRVRKVISEYPSGIRSNDIQLRYRAKFKMNSFGYTTSLNNLKQEFVSFSNKHSVSKTLMEDLLQRVGLFPSKLPDAISFKDDILSELSYIQSILIEFRKMLFDTITDLSGIPKLRDRRINNLKAIANAAFQSPTTSGYVDRQTSIKSEQKKLEDSLLRAKKTDEEFKLFISELEKSTQVVTNMISKKFSSLTRKNIILRRSVRSGPSSGTETLEEFWRDKIRKKYGKDVPFCDELDSEGNPIKIKNADGVEVFAKAKDVIKVDGEYKRLQDVKMDLLKKDYGNPNNDAY